MTTIEEVLTWFENHISQLNEQFNNCDSWEGKEEIQAELKTAVKMKLILSQSIPTREEWEEDAEIFCHECDWHGSCQAHPKE